MGVLVELETEISPGLKSNIFSVLFISAPICRCSMARNIVVVVVVVVVMVAHKTGNAGKQKDV